MKIAAIQMSATADSGRSIERAVEMAALAAEKGAGIICYPELFLSPWFPREEDRSFFTLPHDLSSETLERFRRVSESTKTLLIIPFFESSGGKYFNSAAVMDCGKAPGGYRKIHPPPPPPPPQRLFFSFF